MYDDETYDDDPVDEEDDKNEIINNEVDDVDDVDEVDVNNIIDEEDDFSNDEDGDYDDEDDEVEEDDEDQDEEGDNNKKLSGGGKKNKVSELTTKINIDSQNSDSDSDDSDYEDENYLQKFNNETNKNYVSEFHPECLNHNYDEITALSKVTRDEFNIIIDPLHKTIPYLTKYEKTRILGQRAKQIECGAKPLVKVPENIIDGYIIAELELQQKKIPFIIRRPLPNGGCEYWNLKDLEIITF
jgi:DNA-directed RNA polymerase subunit K/omega